MVSGTHKISGTENAPIVEIVKTFSFRISADCRMNVRYADGFLAIRTAGRESVRNTRNYLRKVVELAHRYRPRRVLIEEALDGSLSFADTLAAINEPLRDAMSLNTRIAFVGVYDGEYSSHLFGERIAMERGLRFRVFSHTGGALEWLFDRNQPI